MKCYWTVRILGQSVTHETFASAWSEVVETLRWEDWRTILSMRLSFKHMTPWAFQRMPESSGR